MIDRDDMRVVFKTSRKTRECPSDAFVELRRGVCPISALGPSEGPSVSSGRKPKPDSVVVDSTCGLLVLTPKQVEFLERMEEYPGYTGPEMAMTVYRYAPVLSDSMDSRAVGAMVTTLRKKKVITCCRVRKYGMYTMEFKLTEYGLEVLDLLPYGYTVTGEEVWV